MEEYFISQGRVSSNVAHFLPACYSWYIPRFGKNDHPCAPAVRINSKEYFFLLKEGYSISGIEDAFHLSLVQYELSDSINKVLAKAKEDDIVIEFYDSKKHFGLDEFYKEINIDAFESVIRSNLELEKPYPFLIISNKGKVEGWTGALWNETSGRGHFDGIAISPNLRNRGLGKALFARLAYESKKNGAKFMTFYTGKDNYARYIYLGAGFKIVQSFAMMTKKLVQNEK
jgi:ribosomal protein S18 acetylase RimI-like enzyme